MNLRLTTNKLYQKLELTQPLNPTYFTSRNLQYFDKDGFELTPLERIIYELHGVPIHNHLYHQCSQVDWFAQDISPDSGLILDHSMLLHRFTFGGALREQIEAFAKVAPVFNKLLKIQPKWGLDFALDYYSVDEALEVFHVELDTRDLETAEEFRVRVEKFVKETDWEYIVERLQSTKDEWGPLQGMAQNDWKARLLGFSKGEITEKAW